MKKQIIALLILAAGTSAMAQPQGGQERDRGDRPTAAEFIERLDKDGDGQVSQEEFDGPDEHFTMSDKNEDGYLSEDEAPKGPPPRGDRQGGRQEER